MDINKVTLMFGNGYESEFKSYYFSKSLKITRISLLLAVFLYGLFGLLDYFVAREFMSIFFAIRFFFVIPIFVLVIILSFTKNFRKYWQGLLFVAFLIASVGIIIMLVILPNDYLYSSGMLLIFIAGYLFIKLRFYLAVIAGWLSIIIYNLFSLLYGEIEPNALLANNLFFISGNLIATFAAYNAEVFDRRNFYLYKKLEDKSTDIRDINKNLEKTIEKRTSLLNHRNEELLNEVAHRIVIEEELITAKEKAEQSDKLKSAFLANMSHEIRTPMNGIIGFANLLDDAEDEEEQKQFINIIIKNGDHLLNLINDIIDLSKIEAGILEVNEQTFNLKVLLKEICDLFKLNTEIISKNLELRSIDSFPNNDVVNITTDRIRLKQILINIVNNACKYTEKGSINIRYVIEKDKLQFYIKDTGIGIKDEFQEHLFDRFMQVTLNNTPKKEGTGLGLAITKTYLKMMGGDIKVRSTFGEGSEFSFYLPIKHNFNYLNNA